jgi:multidrug efflux pump subunit AcrA (membrane-fusion protein)
MLENAMTQGRKSNPVARWSLAGIVAAAAATGGSALVGGRAVAQGVPPAFNSPSVTGQELGVTKPLHEPKLAFVKPGVVAKVTVKEGDVVKAGQVSGHPGRPRGAGRDEVARGRHQGAQLQIDASQADMELKQVQLQRKLDLYGNKPSSEVDEARAAAKVAEISIKYRQQELISAQLKYEAAKIRASQKQLLSPINGIVNKVDVRVGEGSDISRPAFQIVSNDTLYVETTNIPATKVKALQVGQTLQVRYQEDEAWTPAKIVFLSPYAQATSGFRLVRMEMKNDAKREAGLIVHVRLPDAAAPANAAAAARPGESGAVG